MPKDGSHEFCTEPNGANCWIVVKKVVHFKTVKLEFYMWACSIWGSKGLPPHQSLSCITANNNNNNNCCCYWCGCKKGPVDPGLCSHTQSIWSKLGPRLVFFSIGRHRISEIWSEVWTRWQLYLLGFYGAHWNTNWTYGKKMTWGNEIPLEAVFTKMEFH